MRRFLTLAVLGLGAVAYGQQPERAPDPAAIAVVEGLHAALREASAAAHEAVEQRVRMLEPAVSQSHDFDYIARFILRRYWDRLSPEQRADFRRRFETLSVTSYASRFTGLGEESLETTGALKLRPGRVQVDARIHADDGRTVTLSYTLVDDDGWQIVNIIADGVSDLALRRSEYSRVLEEGGFDALLEHIDAQIAELL